MTIFSHMQMIRFSITSPVTQSHHCYHCL